MSHAAVYAKKSPHACMEEAFFAYTAIGRSPRPGRSFTLARCMADDEQKARKYVIFGLFLCPKLSETAETSDEIWPVLTGFIWCNQRAPTDGFAEQNGRDAERADLTCRY